MTKPPRSFRILAASVTAILLPSLAFAQSAAKKARVDDKNAPVTISAEQMTGRPDRDINLDSDVEITRGQTTVNSDKAVFHQIENTIDASGKVRIKRFGDQYAGDELDLNLDSGVGFMSHPTYKLEINNGQGRADRINFESEDRATVVDGTYSTCEGPDPDWYLKAGILHLDMGRELGTASRAVIYFKGVPILGTPAMSFPLTGERKSGVLPPTLGITSKGGVEFSLPYYVNIAPNRDLTLYPKLITKRGLQLGANGRYLGQSYAGETNIEALYDDLQTKTTRYAYSSTHAQTLAPGLLFGWNLNGASDNDYPNDFSSSITASSARLLPREASLSYSADSWKTSARVARYQVLQDIAVPIARPYDRVPQLLFHAGRPDLNGFSWALDSEATRFALTDQELAGRDRGDRINITAQISYPYIRPGYFVTPKLSLNATTYRLENPVTGPTSLSRTLPTFSLDSGLTFERDAKFLGQAMTQTLEPRLFYVHTPYRDQNRFPVFDTADAGFGFAQLFSENRFSGGDRIGDANQITTGLVSRFLESSGAERMRFAIAQRVNFADQRVVLNPAVTTSNQSRSDVLVAATGRLSSSLTVDTGVQYSQGNHRMTAANVGVQWQPGPKRVLNAEYRYLRDTLDIFGQPLDQVNLSGQWPLSQRLYGVARISYALPEHKTAESLFGVEYNADCWVFRAVAQRFSTAAKVSTSQVFLQLELNGLSKLGSNPLEALRKNIAGYQKVNTN